MSKVNKFRMWDNELKEFYPHGFSIDMDNHQWHDDNDQSHDFGDRFILMQWTGLKDKNGVDIYEDDLCHTNNETYGIELHEAGGAYMAVNINKEEREDDVHFLLNCNHFFEVIGHIYEEKK